MKRYDSYKDSGIEWIGEVPEHWEVTKLKFLGDAFGGLTYSPNDVVVNEDEGILVLRSSNIQEGQLSLKDNVFVNLKISEKLTLKKGDILICSRNGSQHLIGKNICIDKRMEGNTFGAFMMVFRSKDWRFLNHFFNSPIFTSQSALFLTATINQLTSNTLNNFWIAIPKSFEEQNQIAKYLDQKTAQIDKLIADKQKLIELLNEERTTMINQAVTKGLEHNVTMKDSGIEWLGEIPAHWEVKKMKYAVKVNSNSLTEDTDSDYEIRYIDIGSVSSSGTINQMQNLKFKDAPSRARRIVGNGNILVSTVRTYLKAITKIESDLPNLIASTGFAVIENEPTVNNDFLYQIIKSDKFIDTICSVSKGVSYPSITATDLLTLPIWLPPLEEQSLIVTEITGEIERTEQIIESSLQEIELLKEYKTALISEVVTGKVDVRDEVISGHQAEFDSVSALM